MKIKRILALLLALAMIIAPMLTSCFDDTQLWDSINKIEHRLDSLETSLNKQLQALNSLIDSKTTISSCEKNQDGSYDVTLSNGPRSLRQLDLPLSSPPTAPTFPSTWPPASALNSWRGSSASTGTL